MKIICDTDILSTACQNVQRSVMSKGAIPSLECILIEAESNTVKLTGYDLEIGCQTEISARVEEKGAVAINARYLCDMLRLMPGAEVIIESDSKDKCTVTGGDAAYSIIGIPADTYPELPCVNDEKYISVPQSILKDMIKKTIFSVAVNDARPIHTGIKFEITENMISLVAIDGFRLAVRKEKTEYTGESFSFVVPAKTLNEIIKLADGEGEGEFKLSIGPRHIIFEGNNYRIISKLLEGDFLDYRSALPKLTTTVIRVDTRELIESVERSSLLVVTDKIKTPVRCVAAEGELNFSNVASLGTAKDKCNAEIEGNDITIGFNARYMIDALRACDEERVKIELNTGSTPIIIKPTEGDKFLFLILPMRLKAENEI